MISNHIEVHALHEGLKILKRKKISGGKEKALLADLSGYYQFVVFDSDRIYFEGTWNMESTFNRYKYWRD